MSSGNAASSKTTRPPFGPIRTLPEARVGLKEILSIAVANAELSDEEEDFVTIRDLVTDIIRVVNQHGSMARLADEEAVLSIAQQQQPAEWLKLKARLES